MPPAEAPARATRGRVVLVAGVKSTTSVLDPHPATLNFPAPGHETGWIRPTTEDLAVRIDNPTLNILLAVRQAVCNRGH